VGAVPTLSAEAVSPDNQLVLKKNSKSMTFNGKALQAAQPLTVKNGSSYAALSSLAGPFGYKLSYAAATKESIASNGTIELRFKPGSSTIIVNGSPVEGPGPTFVLKGSLMVPLRMWANLTGSKISGKGTDTVITWKGAPKADFTVQPDVIYAGQTVVTYLVDGAPSVLDQADENEVWEGRQDVFLEPGPHTVTRRVKDEYGSWSEPYSVTIDVQMPNQPPVADFMADKPVYRIGEPVLLTDTSTDDRISIKSSKWSGTVPTGFKPGVRPLAYFEPGNYPVTLEVQDEEGLTNSVTKTIAVTSEVLYTQEEFDLLFMPVGEKYAMDGPEVLRYPTVTYKSVNDPAQLVNSNSPERWVTTGLAYRSQLTGKARFLFYNENTTGYRVKMYLIATNTSGLSAKVGVGAWGQGGPDKISVNSGKMAAVRYLDALNRNTPVTYTTLAAGESTILLPELSNVPIKPGEVYSAYADIVSDKEITYRIVVLRDTEDPKALFGALDSIQPMPRDMDANGKNLHVRGTFFYADRHIEISETQLGRSAERIVLGDSKVDKLLDGIDEMTGDLEYNHGNFGVLYRMRINVAPNTLIGLNARGGEYTGAFIVNGGLVQVTNTSILKNPNETVVLHRTGVTSETVDIVFTIASASNTPINIVFLPMPERRA
jgi:PKD repeat protein